ncbi:MAG: PEP/pyruvate-binding domain-containing protein [Rikenellaceae bacterium]
MALKLTNYTQLMQHRIRKVLLICSSYDSFTLEEDGMLESQINSEYLELNLSDPPEFLRAHSATEARDILDSSLEIDLIITMLNIGEIDPFSFALEVKSSGQETPIVLLSHFSREISLRLDNCDMSGLDYVFCWLGNADLILAIIKLVEDKMNAENDIAGVGVQSILLVEDSIRFYSTYLPQIYKLVLNQSQEFLIEALNEQQKMLRRRARPKILFARTYDEAMNYYTRYRENILGVISDITFKIHGYEEDEVDAGIYLTEHIKKENNIIPIILQSSRLEMREKAHEMGVGFIHKYSKTLLMDLSTFIRKEFFFGALVFRDLEQEGVKYRVRTLADLQKSICDLDIDTLTYYSEQNHISKWLFARGLFSLARELRDINITQFNTPKEFRKSLVQTIKEYRNMLGQGVIAQFDAQSYNNYIWLSRMGSGSMGGKGRGLAFINKILEDNELYHKFENVRISIPRTVVIATDYFDEFITSNGLQYVINSDSEDVDILSEFVGSRLPEKLVEELKAYIRTIRYPIAVRSSSKLEDSYFQPFAGIYSTYMIPLTENEDQMLRILGKAIKSVYASVFFAASRSYLLATSNVISEEKMAIILQEICGTEDNGVFFPTISGVARSINYYPIENEKAEDGIANIAFGLGKMVVDGGQSLRFSPKHSKKIIQLSTTAMALSETQREFYALNLGAERFKTSVNDSINLDKIEINKALNMRNLRYVASTWDRDNDRISDSFMAKGRKLITFSNILKYDSFPLASILTSLLEIGRNEMKTEVELEFAVNMDTKRGENMIFNFLQIRPIVQQDEKNSLDWSKIETSEAIVYANSALGLGKIDNVHDIIYIKEDTFKSSLTEKIATEIEQHNRKLSAQGVYYVLIGPGRWGSSDPWLGVPVRWASISNARVIIESGLKDFRVDPSQGTHFFQNMTSLGVGYMTLNPHIGDGVYQIDKLNEIEAIYEGEYIRHIRLESPLNIFIDGKENKGVVTF